MEFTVPKFIEREAKIMGPLTLKQFIYLAIPGAICFFFYFSIGKKNFFLFVLASMILFGIGLALGFVRIKGVTLPVFFKNLFFFLISSKIFIWKKKILPPRFRKVEKFKKEVEEEPLLKVAERSNIQKLSTLLETRKR